ncbi:MAG: hypothetical protein JNL70_15105 [Saprospiraceae bacterium]|nr:hypothetical protein [Saprospiraceae bacterium]
MVEVKEKPKFWEEDWLNIPMGELDIRTLSPERYEAYQYWLVHEAEAKRYEKEVIEKGRMEGIMQGMMQGKIEGIKEGRMEGRMEGEIKMLKDLVKKGVLSFKSIETVPNISSELIQKAKEEIINELLTEDLLPLSSIAQIADVSEDVVLKVKNARD